MNNPSLSPFERPGWHAAIAKIVRSRSSNPADVREVALQGLDLSSARHVLDVGCGFGFMSETVAQRVAPDARIIGVDACPANEQPFMKHVKDAGRTGTFVCRRIDRHLDWPDGSFDLVVASYSLYFFPRAIPDLARVLSADGLLVALTHVEQSCRDLLRVIGAWGGAARAIPTSRSFSAENGSDLLTPWFDEVERVEYPNSLVFRAEHRTELLAYLRFKLPFVSPDIVIDGELPEPLHEAALLSLSRHGRVVVAKNDAAFRCRRPRRA